MPYNFEIGDVICWEKFPFPKGDGKIKDRWFIFLSEYQSEYDGVNSLFDSIHGEKFERSNERIFVLLVTTTTQFYHTVEQEGDYLEFFESEGFGFSRDCVLLQDYSFRDDIRLTEFEEHVAQGRVTQKGSISNQKLSEVWKIISNAKSINFVHKERIFRELQTKNITGLAALKAPIKKKFGKK